MGRTIALGLFSLKYLVLLVPFGIPWIARKCVLVLAESELPKLVQGVVEALNMSNRHDLILALIYLSLLHLFVSDGLP